MATDEERREVARRLRELNPNDPAWNGIHGFDFPYFADAFFDAIYQNGYESGNWAERLADLIEPSEHKTKCIAEVKINEDKIHEFVDEEAAYLREAVHQASVELIGIDRDALLALADEMNSDADFWDGFTVCMLYTRDVREYARRIREACGVDNG